MNISRQNAMQIVFDISNIINQHINMMDENGLIIASTDPERVGTVHEAAQRIINENLDSLIIHENYEYKGSRKGLNLPILLDNAIVGVIGVTGDYRDVAKYGQIIKKMTEILLLENYSQEQKKIDDRIKTRFLDEWVFEDAPGGCDRAFIDRGNRFGIDEKSTRPHQAYQRAKKALSAGRYAGEPIYFYDDITVEIFMDEISDASRKEFLMRIFRGFGDEEIAYWINFLRV
ncbi:MAG: hypothetical protein LBG12_05040, partial [Synergistaceae bacterium]|nr:hypothetical protein [Synergistaceae bacterium]